MAYKITYSNFKGGTGKTTNSTMMGYHLAAKGFKTLLIDLDPQANATALYSLTRQSQTGDVMTFNKTLMSAIAEDDVESIITPIRGPERQRGICIDKEISFDLTCYFVQ